LTQQNPRRGKISLGFCKKNIKTYLSLRIAKSSDQNLGALTGWIKLGGQEEKLGAIALLAASHHSFAFFLFLGSFKISVGPQICQNASLGDLTLESAQGGINAFVFT
jgi:hypothetical protein